MDPRYFDALQALRYCRFLPGSFDKRFVRDLSSLPSDAPLTERQMAQVERLVVHFRTQLARMGYVAPMDLQQAHFDRKRLALGQTPDEVKYHWVRGQLPLENEP